MENRLSVAGVQPEHLEVSQVAENHHYFVRYGVQANVSRFRAGDAGSYRRNQRVICETDQGLFVGVVLSAVSANEATAARILRLMTAEDELLQERLERHKREAVLECRQRIADAGLQVELMDVDHLFDGRTLIFYFLGEIPSELDQITDSLAQRYEQRVRTGEFARLLEDGCGPGCGTPSKGGCGSNGGCAVCMVAGGCSTKKRKV